MKRSRILRRSSKALLLLGVLALIVVMATRWVAASQANRSAWSVLGITTAEDARKAEIATSQKQLQAITDTMSSAYGTNIGLVVADLSNGASATTNADTQFVSASIYKLFVSYGVYKKIDAGTVSYGDTLTAYGTSRTVQECLDDMLTVSDNTCGKALGALNGWSTLDSMLASEGYTHTMLNNYDARGNLLGDKMTTANDVALLLTRLYAGTLLGKTSTEHFLSLLKADEITYMLPSGLPSGTVVAHKVGFLDQYQHDAGIIYGTRKDMLVVMLTKGWTTSPTTQATAAFTKLDQAVWAYAETE